AGERVDEVEFDELARGVADARATAFGDMAAEPFERAHVTCSRSRSCEMESARAAHSICSLPPLWGRVGEGGGAFADVGAPIARPPPPTPPHKGEGSTPSVRRPAG